MHICDKYCWLPRFRFLLLLRIGKDRFLTNAFHFPLQLSYTLTNVHANLTKDSVRITTKQYNFVSASAEWSQFDQRNILVGVLVKIPIPYLTTIHFLFSLSLQPWNNQYFYEGLNAIIGKRVQDHE